MLITTSYFTIMFRHVNWITDRNVELFIIPFMYIDKVMKSLLVFGYEMDKMVFFPPKKSPCILPHIKRVVLKWWVSMAKFFVWYELNFVCWMWLQLQENDLCKKVCKWRVLSHKRMSPLIYIWDNSTITNSCSFQATFIF